ncbi:hypothetical protein [Salmonella sp. s55044]|uniref:hypothetical protein n=1 Tax=Salmonella sp. s55044 TaxID=3159677 RepID=UPI0039806D1F
MMTLRKTGTALMNKMDLKMDAPMSTMYLIMDVQMVMMEAMMNTMDLMKDVQQRATEAMTMIATIPASAILNSGELRNGARPGSTNGR